MSVLVVTSLGDIVVDLHADRCPLTCKNFLKLCKIKYYNGSLFHTVQKDFTAQTGDPTGTGTGGDSIYKFLYGDQARFFGDEISLDLKHSKTGTVAMASAGENLNASQFYFTLRDDLDYLDGKHTVFGEVAEGLETLTRINEAYVDEKGRPYRNIRIKHTYILDDPFDDPPQLPDHIPDASPEGRPKDEVDDDVRLEDDWVPMDEQLGRSELEEILRAKQAHSSAVVLESIGDIPDAEIKPPDNVLFVCKLNPVTEDEDLHTIFSRFGTVTSADIIRDFKTGDSLCYAFIEFETKEACEQAYFKMDNALIDDRRIHVDFSQSVARLWSQYRRKDNQKGKGGGCFKCGSLDHIAKDCTGEPASKQQPPKYILKDDNTQRGGHNNTRYEMVFNEETPRSPQQDKKHRDYAHEGEKQKPNRQSSEELRHRDHGRKDVDGRHREIDRSIVYEHEGEKQKPNRQSSEELRHRDYGRKEVDGGHRESDRSRGFRENERRRERKATQPSGSRRDGYLEERMEREKYVERRDKDKTDERDYRKRNVAGDNRDVRKVDGDNRKRSADDDGRGDRRDDRDYKKGFNGTDRRDKKDESSHRKGSLDDDRRDDRDYEKGFTGTDRRDKKDEPSYRKRSLDDNGHRRENREHRRRNSESGDDHDRHRDRDKRHQSEKRR